MAYIEFQDVKKIYKTGDVEVHALDGAEFSIEKGELCVILGQSGAGKTTLLNIMGGMDTLTSGTVILDGKKISDLKEKELAEYRRSDVGFVFQFYNLIPNLTAIENVEMASQLVSDPMDPETVLKDVGLSDRSKNFPAQLSGGERARLKLCMLMNSAVNMLILDEPTNHLDLDSREWIESAVDQFEGTLLIVSHDRYFVNRFATRIWELDDGELRNYDCGYKKYRFIRERELEAKQAQDALEKSAQRQREKAEKAEKRQTGRKDGKTERRMAMIERDIAKLEQQCEALDAQMAENASDYVRLGELQAEKDALQEKIDALYMEWDALGG